MGNLAWQRVRSDVPDCFFLSVARDQRVGSDWLETSSCCSVGGVMPTSCPSAGQSSKGVAARCCWAALSGLLMPLSKMSQEESAHCFWNKFLSCWASAQVTCLNCIISPWLDKSRAGPAEAKLRLE